MERDGNGARGFAAAIVAVARRLRRRQQQLRRRRRSRMHSRPVKSVRISGPLIYPAGVKTRVTRQLRYSFSSSSPPRSRRTGPVCLWHKITWGAGKSNKFVSYNLSLPLVSIPAPSSLDILTLAFLYSVRSTVRCGSFLPLSSIRFHGPFGLFSFVWKHVRTDATRHLERIRGAPLCFHPQKWQNWEYSGLFYMK